MPVSTTFAPELAPAVQRTVDLFVGCLDAVIPGVFDDVLLVGSASCDDFSLRTSDVGFVAVSAKPLSHAQMENLRALHLRLAVLLPTPPLDGLYVTERDLTEGPLVGPAGPCVRRGHFVASGCHKRRPLDWQAVATGSLCLRGRGAEDLNVWMDRVEFERDLLRAVDDLVGSMRDPPSLDPGATSSMVLEAVRLHFALLTGRVTTKTRAGLYGLITFPERWHFILDAALASRATGSAPDLLPSDAAAFVRSVATDMRELAQAITPRPA